MNPGKYSYEKRDNWFSIKNQDDVILAFSYLEEDAKTVVNLMNTGYAQLNRYQIDKKEEK